MPLHVARLRDSQTGPGLPASLVDSRPYATLAVALSSRQRRVRDVEMRVALG
jgi:hypothetical protein